MSFTATEIDLDLFADYTVPIVAMILFNGYIIVTMALPVWGQIKGEIVRQSLDGHGQKSFKHGIFGHQHSSSAAPK